MKWREHWHYIFKLIDTILIDRHLSWLGLFYMFDVKLSNLLVWIQVLIINKPLSASAPVLLPYSKASEQLPWLFSIFIIVLKTHVMPTLEDSHSYAIHKTTILISSKSQCVCGCLLFITVRTCSLVDFRLCQLSQSSSIATFQLIICLLWSRAVLLTSLVI